MTPADLQTAAFDRLAIPRKNEWRARTDSNRGHRFWKPALCQLSYMPLLLIWWVRMDSNHRANEDLVYSQVQSTALPHTHQNWCRRRDSNPRRPALQAGALPIELPRGNLAPRAGVEPAASG